MPMQGNQLCPVQRGCDMGYTVHYFMQTQNVTWTTVHGFMCTHKKKHRQEEAQRLLKAKAFKVVACTLRPALDYDAGTLSRSLDPDCIMSIDGVVTWEVDIVVSRHD